MIDVPVAPLDHTILFIQPVAVKVIFSGLQISAFDAVITGAEELQTPPHSDFAVMITGDDAPLVPQAFLQVAE